MYGLCYGIYKHMGYVLAFITYGLCYGMYNVKDLFWHVMYWLCSGMHDFQSKMLWEYIFHVCGWGLLPCTIAQRWWKIADDFCTKFFFFIILYMWRTQPILPIHMASLYALSFHFYTRISVHSLFNFCRKTVINNIALIRVQTYLVFCLHFFCSKALLIPGCSKCSIF